MRKFRLYATPHFTEVYCPKGHGWMKELQNGFLGDPVFWCIKCDYPYQLQLVKMRKYNESEARRQLNSLQKKGKDNE